MVIIGLGKENIEKGRKYNVSYQVAEVLISRGLAYKEGDPEPIEEQIEKPKRRGRKPKKED